MRLLSEFAHEVVGSLTTICNIKYTYLYTSDISFFRTGKRERMRERAMMKLKMYINIRFEKEARPRYERAVDFLLSQFVITP